MFQTDIPASLDRDSPARKVAMTKEQKVLHMDEDSKLSAFNVIMRKEVN